MIIPHSNSTAERAQIEATFRYGWGMVKSAIWTLLYAIIMLCLAIVHIASFVVNILIGVLTIMRALICMARLLLVQCQNLAAMGPQMDMIRPRGL